MSSFDISTGPCICFIPHLGRTGALRWQFVTACGSVCGILAEQTLPICRGWILQKDVHIATVYSRCALPVLVAIHGDFNAKSDRTDTYSISLVTNNYKSDKLSSNHRFPQLKTLYQGRYTFKLNVITVQFHPPTPNSTKRYGPHHICCGRRSLRRHETSSRLKRGECPQAWERAVTCRPARPADPPPAPTDPGPAGFRWAAHAQGQQSWDRVVSLSG